MCEVSGIFVNFPEVVFYGIIVFPDLGFWLVSHGSHSIVEAMCYVGGQILAFAVWDT